MESKHTPGPWRSDLVTCASGRSVRAIAATSHRICDVRVYDARDAANVRLMVAAPELLAALDRANRLLAELTFTTWIKGDDAASVDIRQRIKSAHEAASDAIAKAEAR